MVSSNGAANGGAVNGANGSGGHSYPLPAFDQGQSEGLVDILVRQRGIIVLSVVVWVLAAVIYLMVTKTSWTSKAALRVEPLDKSIATSASGTASSLDDPAGFLPTECGAIKSTSVLALAMEKIKDTRTLKGIPRPIEYLKKYMSVEVSKDKGQVIEISIASRWPEEANLIVESVIDAYRQYNTNYLKTRANELLDMFHAGQQHNQAEIDAKVAEMTELQMKYRFSNDGDPSKNPLRLEVENLRQAENAANLEAIQAKNECDQAANSINGDPAKVAAVEEAEKSMPHVSDPREQLKTTQDELLVQQTQLHDKEKDYLPNHPVIRTIRSRIDQLEINSIVLAHEWWQNSQSRAEAIHKSLEETQNILLTQAASETQYRRLQNEVEQLRRGDQEVLDQIRKIDLSKGAGAMNIIEQDAAAIEYDAPSPAKKKTLGIAMALGVICGLGLACVRDWSDDRLRTATAVKSVTGVPILGAIPSITTAYTAADRGQIVHHEPFGPAAESYRSLRTALQFGLPAGVHTLLVTSPVSGDGKSTLVSNLGIAIAQAGKRVLIVDADFRAPVQHRLFGLKDRTGFATVLAGTEEIENAIQRTEIERLDVLPCGPVPSSPSEMLNDPAFNDHLNELADKYDLVIIDSPPVTAVADARILAASADACLLVVRPETSTRKQVEAARDGLRSVGARLVGVAVNGVSGQAHFGGASGYYSRPDATPAKPVRITSVTKESMADV